MSSPVRKFKWLFTIYNYCWVQCDSTIIFFIGVGKLLEVKRPHLYWTLWAAHCNDLMSEDIGKIPHVKNTLKKCIYINGYIYNNIQLVILMRKFTNQRNLHIPVVTRFASSLTKGKYEEEGYFCWVESIQAAKEYGGKKIAASILLPNFWRNVLYALKLARPLVKVLRMVMKPWIGLRRLFRWLRSITRRLLVILTIDGIVNFTILCMRLVIF